MQENNIGTKDELESLLVSTKLDQQQKHDELIATENQLKTVNQKIYYSGQYQMNKSTYSTFLKAKNKAKFRQEHESEILLYETARKDLKQLYGDSKFHTLKLLYEEKNELTDKKNFLYDDYSFARAKYKEIQTVNTNVTTYLNEKDISENNNQAQDRADEAGKKRIEELIKKSNPQVEDLVVEVEYIGEDI